jgi:hypothetical protein
LQENYQITICHGYFTGATCKELFAASLPRNCEAIQLKAGTTSCQERCFCVEATSEKVRHG